MACNEFEEGIVSLAEGRSAPEAQAHVERCGPCTMRLAQTKRLLASIQDTLVDAPAELIVRAQSLMRARPRLVARLLGNGLASSGARRSEARDFALHVGVEGFSIHLHYSPFRDGWEVLGRAPTAGWTVAYEGGEVPCGTSGRFRLIAAGLDGTMFVLRKEGTEIEVPSAQEMIEIGS